jgi:cyclic dehypoxanthinyl futalosine synthase
MSATSATTRPGAHEPGANGQEPENGRGPSGHGPNGHGAAIEAILARVHAGERIGIDEALLLYEHADLLDLGAAASARRRRLVPGDTVTYLIDRNINYTNVCVTDCSFCGFYRPNAAHPEAYVNSKEVLGRKIEEALTLGATRILMQGGHNPNLPFEYYTELVAWIHTRYPAIEIDAFSPSEIEFIGQISGKSWEAILSELQACGLAGLPGGGGEILDDEVRRRVSPKKIMTANWLGVMQVAHRLGLTTTATMVIGFGETLRQRLNHLQRLRDTQDDSLARYGCGFNAFISWPLQHNANTSMGRSRHRGGYGATAAEYLRHTAIARIVLDNIPHLSASWPTMGEKIGLAALSFGCDDMGSTMIEENVVSQAGAPTAFSCVLEVEEFQRLIRSAGYVPAQRNTAYDILQRFDEPASAPAILE